MLKRIQQRSKNQRLLIFIVVFVGIVLLLLIGATLLSLSALNSGGRVEAQALVPDVTVAQYAILPGDEAFPAALAVAPDATVYTGSYLTGALWSIDTDGAVVEIPATDVVLASIVGLTFAQDGTLYIVARNDPDPRTAGGSLQRLSADGVISEYTSHAFVSPDDVAIDSQGSVYVSDRGSDEIWRFNVGGADGFEWWTPPALEGIEAYEPTGLAYDAANDAIIVTDPLANTIYRVPVESGEAELLYQHGDRQFPPGFDGVTVAADGTIYVAALGQNGVVELRDGELVYIAGNFRGASDVDLAPDGRHLYVTNFDQSSIGQRYQFGTTITQPQLPFALDVVTLSS
ncbi:MAG: hypothetical protein H7175_02930 [Burkholderiales bacterium]|nr:hypothetical protein [Anaerolineae bacterium]